MDFKVKGISWVGNVYQKFEAMCLEVEDVMCQETAKYVETQVQTVGSSVKKFYSEVLQDLLPPSSLDLKKSEGSALFLEHDAAFGSYEKRKPSAGEVPVKKNSSIHDTPEVTHPAIKSFCQEQSDGVDICIKPKTGGDEYNKRQLPVEMSDVINCSGKISQVVLRSRVQNKGHLLPSQSVSPVIAADLRSPREHKDNGEERGSSHMHSESGPKANLPVPDVIEPDAPAGKGTSPASSLSSRLEEDHGKALDTPERLTSPTLFDLPVCDSFKTTVPSCSVRVTEIAADTSSPTKFSLVSPVISCESKVVENELSTLEDISTESNVLGSSATSYTLPLNSSWTEPEESSEEKSDDDTAGLEEGDDIIELVPEMIDEFRNGKLDESCIVVDREELPFIPHQPGRQRSYKKKIRDALASRMRLAKKQEYEQLAIWHEDVDNPSRTESSGQFLCTEDMKISCRDIGETEWELL